MLSKIIRILVLAILISAPAYALAFDKAVECDPAKTIIMIPEIISSSSELQEYFLSSNLESNATCDETKCVLCFESESPFPWKATSPLVISNWSDKKLIIYNLNLNFDSSPASKAMYVSGRNIIFESLKISGTPQQVGMEVYGNGHKINNSSIGDNVDGQIKPFAKGIILGSERIVVNGFELNNTQIFANENFILLYNAKGGDFIDELQIPKNMTFAINSLSPVVIDQNSFGVVCSKIKDGKLNDVDVKYCPSDEAGENKFNVLAGVMPEGIKDGQVKVYKASQGSAEYFGLSNESMSCPVSAITEPFYMTNNSYVRTVEACENCYKFECPAVAERALENAAYYFMIYEGATRDDVVIDQNGSNILTYVPTSKDIISVIGAVSIPGTVSDATGGVGAIEIGGTSNAIETDTPMETAPDGTPLIIDTGSNQTKAASKGSEQSVGQGGSGGCGGQQSLSGSKMPSVAAMVVGLLAIGGLPALIPARIRARRKH